MSKWLKKNYFHDVFYSNNIYFNKVYAMQLYKWVNEMKGNYNFPNFLFIFCIALFDPLF